jgi:osmotically-inducible protein OsmY
MSVRRQLVLAALLAPCLLALSGCELAVLGAASGVAYSIAEDRRTSGVQYDDESIQLRAQSRISDRFGDKAHITVTSFNRMALLTGEAPEEGVRSEIAKIVEGVPSVRAITNEIQISLPTPRASRITDEYISSKVKAQLIGKANPVYVKVVTEAGVVYLMGVVSEQEASDAVEIARTTSGVRKVVKIFEYCKAGEEVCRPHTKESPPPPKSGTASG